MRYVAAYLLLQIGGNASPTAEDIKRVLGSVGIEADDERLEKLIAALKDKDVNELIAQGSAKLASVPSGGVGSGVAAPTTAAIGTAGKTEEVEAEAEGAGEESDEDFGISLFD